MKEIIKKVSPKDIMGFAVKYFSDFKVSNDPYEKIYAYYIDDVIIGFISFSVIYERAEINYFAVEEKYRGKGYSQKLFDYMIFSIKKCENISLEVRCDNERAIGFYLKNDFKKVSVRKNYYDEKDAYLMIKKMR